MSRKALTVKPQRPLGERIGPVRIFERGSSRKSLFIIERLSTGDRLGWRWQLDEVIGFCHENLIPIEKIERLEDYARELRNG